MAHGKTRWWLVVGGGMLAGLLLAACVALLLRLTAPAVGGGYRSNGEQIYFTGVNARGERIPFTDAPMWLYRHGGGCASCHGPDGRGGQVRMMMDVFEVPDIRYQALTSQEHGEGDEEEMEHEPFTDQTIGQAITEGVEPDGEPLDWPMPRWSMSREDLHDLLEFLKTLE
jgi:mono/diheme cytochrome c family protein